YGAGVILGFSMDSSLANKQLEERSVRQNMRMTVFMVNEVFHLSATFPPVPDDFISNARIWFNFAFPIWFLAPWSWALFVIFCLLHTVASFFPVRPGFFFGKEGASLPQ
ncbi:MAG TPA: hypothetical protein VMH30_01775, partial [Verrucomicrobiae bacterium]|nr:hypothetical protein [Verrucomicrobiae bacterium]